MSENSEPGPLRVGVLINWLEIKYMHLIWQALQDSAEKLNIKLLAFVGESLQSLNEPDNQQNFIYSFINKETVDGVIFVPSVGVFISTAAYRRFLLHFNDIPGVSLSVKCDGIPSVLIDCAGGIRQAIRHCLDYHRYRRLAFIRGPVESSEAEDRFLAYKETLQEYNIPFDPALVFQGDFVISSGKKAAYELLRKRKQKPDVIIAANDDMALGAIQVIHELGLNVPNDLAVIGFDDWEETRFHIPSISSVKQPLREQAHAALDMLKDMIQGRTKGRDILLPTRFMIRQSCGCFIPEKFVVMEKENDFNLQKRETVPAGVANPDTYLEKMQARVLQSLGEDTVGVKPFFTLLKRFINKEIGTNEALSAFSDLLNDPIYKHRDIQFFQEIFHFVCSGIRKIITDTGVLQLVDTLLLELCLSVSRYLESRQAQGRFSIEATAVALLTVSQRLITAFNFDELFTTIGRHLPTLGISSMYLFLFERPIFPSGEYFWDISAPVKIALAVKGGCPTHHTDNIFPANIVISHILAHEDPKKDWIIMPLAFTTELFGFILLETGTHVDIVYETLRMQISSAIKGARLFDQQKHIEDELKKANVELESLSLLDELTGLYNRRGFITLSTQIWKMAGRSGMQFLIVFMDLDRLKNINDNYGHKEGDAVLQAFAEILKIAFRRNDVLARLGGDEFVVLSYNASLEHRENIRQRVENTISHFNASSGKPYNLSVSLGFSCFEQHSTLTIDEMLKAADKELYQDKFEKRKGSL